MQWRFTFAPRVLAMFITGGAAACFGCGGEAGGEDDGASDTPGEHDVQGQDDGHEASDAAGEGDAAEGGDASGDGDAAEGGDASGDGDAAGDHDQQVTASLTVAHGLTQLRLAREQTIEVPLTIVRSGFDSEVVVTVEHLPAGVTAGELTIGAAANEGALSLTAGSTTALATSSTVTITATAGDIIGKVELDLLLTDQPGRLDESFGDGGIMTYDLSGADEAGVAAALQSDGKLVVGAFMDGGASLHVLRLSGDGRLDTTFSGDGDVELESTGDVSVGAGRNIAVRQDGSILFAYETDLRARVSGVDRDGEPLTGFGEAGGQSTLGTQELGGPARWVTMETDSVGGAFVATVLGDSNFYSTRISKLTSGGAPDPSFGIGGSVSFADLVAYSMSRDGADRLLLSGKLFEDPMFARLTPAGTLDPSFAGDGIATPGGLGGPDWCWFGVVGLGGGGMISQISWPKTTLAVVDEAGELVPAFSDDGLLSLPARLAQFTVLGDEVIAAVDNGGGFDVYRVSLADGSLRTGFDGDGVAHADFGVSSATTLHVLIDSLGRLIIVGFVGNADNDIAIARMWL